MTKSAATPTSQGVTTPTSQGVTTPTLQGVTTPGQQNVTTPGQHGVVTAPVLETERLRLRQWTLADFEPLSDFLVLEELNQYRGGALTRSEAWEFLCARAGDWQIRGLGCFVIEEKKSGAAVGFCGLWHPFDLNEPELAWSLYPKFHRKGYAVEAVTAVKVWAHETLKLPPLMSFVHPDNAPSIALAERLGASIEELTTFGGEPRYRYRHVSPGAYDNGARANGAGVTNSRSNQTTNQLNNNQLT